MVVLRPDNELNYSSRLDETVLVSTKAALSALSRSSVLKNPSDPYLLKSDVAAKCVECIFYIGLYCRYL